MAIGKNVTSAIATSASMLAAAAALARSKSLESQLKDVQEELRVKSIENSDLVAASKLHSQVMASAQTAAQEQLEQVRASMGDALKQKEAQLDSSTARTSEQERTIERLRAELQVKEDATSVISKQLDDSAATIASLESANASCEEKSLRTQEELDKERRVSQEAASSMMKQMQESSCAISDFKQQVAALEIAKQELQIKWSESLKTIDDLETRVASLREQGASIEVLQNEVRQLSLQNEQLKASNLVLEQEKSRADAADVALECLRTESTAAIEELKLENERLTERAHAVESLEKQLVDEKRRASLAKVVMETKIAQLSEPVPQVTAAAAPEPVGAPAVHDDEELIRQLEPKEQRKTEASTAQKSKRKAKGSK